MPRRAPNLQRRRNVWHFRMGVPEDVRSIIGKHEIIKSLKTEVYKEAVARVSLERARADALIAKARRQLGREVRYQISEHDVRQLALLWLWEEEGRYLRAPPIRDREEALDILDTDEAVLGDPDDEQGFAAACREADKVLADSGVSLRFDHPMFQLMVRLLGRAMLESTRRAKDQLLGDMSGRSHDVLFEGVNVASPKPGGKGAGTGSVTLGQLCDSYADWPGRPRSTRGLMDLRAAFRPMLEVLGRHTPAADVTLGDMRQVYELMVRLPSNATKRWRGLTLAQAADRAEREGVPPMNPRTCNGYLTKLRNLFDWAQAEGIVEGNPVSKNFRVAAPRRSRRQLREAFDREQLEAIFGHRTFTRPDPRKPGKFFVPILALWTGARLNELLQLEVDDVVEEDGVPAIWVRDGEGKRLKTPGARRIVPLHPAIVDAGFLDHVEAMRAGGQQRVFPDCRMGEDGYYSSPYSKWFARLLRQVGAKTQKHGFHSFRHTFADACREAGVPNERMRAMAGWAGGAGTDAHYGSGFQVRTLYEEVRKLQYCDTSLTLPMGTRGDQSMK